MMVQLSNKNYVHILVVAVLGLLIYSNTFSAPFVFDDARYIVDNPAIQDLQYFRNPSSVQSLDLLPELQHAFRTRILGHLTFALNYKVNHLDVTGYHVVNFVIHVLNGLLVYWLVLLTFATPFFTKRGAGEGEPGIVKYRDLIAFLSALFFISHPIQTQAITYITQRFASLATLFYVLSVVAYARSRLSVTAGMKYASYAVALGSAVLAMLTKEICFTLPAILVLYELMFFNGRLQRRVASLVPFVMTMAIIPFSLLAAGDRGPDIQGFSESMEKLAISHDVSRWEYLITQFRVIVTYLKLLVFPVDQNLYYDYPVSRSILEPTVLLSLLLLLVIAFSAVYLFFRSLDPEDRHRHSFRLFAFGIFWFFVTLSMESSIIPIKDVIFEHRVYLPSVGIFIAFVVAIFGGLDRFGLAGDGRRGVAAAILFVAVLALAGTAYVRNGVWGSEIRLWEDVVSKSPAMPYNHMELSFAYERAERLDDAIREYTTAITLDEEYVNHYTLGTLYLRADRFEEAILEFSIMIERYPDHTSAYNNLGLAYEKLGRIEDAKKQYVAAGRVGSANAHFNLGKLYEAEGNVDGAVAEYLAAIQINLEHGDAHNNLATNYARLGRIDDAIEHFLIAADLDPGSAQIHYNLGVMYGQLGRVDKAIREFLRAIDSDQGWDSAHYNLGVSYRMQGRFEEAIREFQITVELNPNHAAAMGAIEDLARRKN